MELIGYTCSYIPVELLSATGLRPYRLLHGDINLSKLAEKLVRVDACPIVKSNLSYVINNRDKFKAIVGATGCDMARRMFDVLSKTIDIPVYVINNPRTDYRKIFDDEIDWLVKQLESFSKRKFTEQLLSGEIKKWENQRALYRELDQKRSSSPALISTANFHQFVMNYYQGIMIDKISLEDQRNDKLRVYLLGSAVSYESNQILQLLEKDLHIVGDYNCGLSRFLNIRIEDKTLAGIKSAYYHQPPCIFKRPNNKFYEFIGKEIRRLNCVGIIAWTLDYCDCYEFELKKIEQTFDLPVMRIKSDFSFQGLSQIKTRIDAFVELVFKS